MKAKHLLLALLSFMMAHQSLNAQFGFSHELGVITGPVAFQADYGERGNQETNIGNTGFGVGIVHYLNFSYQADCNCYSRYTYFNDHFKVRNEIDYHFTNLDNFGPETDDNDFGGLRLRNHKGKASVLEIGSHLEYYPLSIRDFAAGAFKFAPYVSLGAHFVSYNPSATTDLRPDGNIFGQVLNPYTQDPFDTGPAIIEGFNVGDGEFGTGVDTRPGTTWAIAGSIGTRYKLSVLSDLNLDLRWHYYFSNWVDGLNPDPRPDNKVNDWIFWINVGYIYYLD
ncbi:THC0290_0291 family protein [Dokdonia sp. R86516]|uniref:THC0290_0291 family protein n=1 Tax=Dokdonia sp. R86516 TaxID=3093856 RepID=UPI0037C70904